MWLFITKRFRTWLLLTVGLPLTRRGVDRLGVGAVRPKHSAPTPPARSNPD
jgi:hypothetical protein